MSSAPHTERDAAGAADVWAIAVALAGQPVVSVKAVSGGGNSRIYKVVGERDTFALKAYPHHDHDPRDRLGKEYDALELLARHGVEAVPRPRAADREGRYGLYEWLEGERIGTPAAADIDECLALVARLGELSRSSAGAKIGPASAACLSAAAVAEQIDERLDDLRCRAIASSELEWFLAREFAPVVVEKVAGAKLLFARARLDFDRVLAPHERLLSPSDFGFHNAVRRRDGALQFFDFEYFGWDDPAKLVADFLLHPGMNLSVSLQRRFYGGTRIALRLGASFEARFGALYPLFGLCWCLILLNPFLPERSAMAHDSAAPIRARQLDRARALLHKVKHHDGENGGDL